MFQDHPLLGPGVKCPVGAFFVGTIAVEIHLHWPNAEESTIVHLPCLVLPDLKPHGEAYHLPVSCKVSCPILSTLLQSVVIENQVLCT